MSLKHPSTYRRLGHGAAEVRHYRVGHLPSVLPLVSLYLKRGLEEAPVSFDFADDLFEKSRPRLSSRTLTVA